MPVKIMRANGKIEELKPATIKNAIKSASNRAEISDYYEKQLEGEVTDKIIKDLKGVKELNSSELKEKLIAELETVERAASELAKEIRNLEDSEFL
ncbi:MAG: hypothetical protein HZB68_03675 [Candidatus Aenigmarchaeota archaeon]|nr:hypothetical protein [Candidatus Aenigmarchaeota archaeon]